MRIRTLSAVAAIVTLAACGGSDGGTTPVRTVSTVKISGATTTLTSGQTLQLTAVAADGGGATIANPGIVLWSSTATKVATVDQSGKVTGVSAGYAIITADAAGVKGAYSITVNAVATTAKDTIFTIGMTAFSPAALPVSVGATVVFALGFDGIGHDVQFAAAPGSPAYIPVAVRSYVRVVFPTAGTFPYTCPTHPQMTGTITVQ